MKLLQRITEITNALRETSAGLTHAPELNDLDAIAKEVEDCLSEYTSQLAKAKALYAGILAQYAAASVKTKPRESSDRELSLSEENQKLKREIEGLRSGRIHPDQKEAAMSIYRTSKMLLDVIKGVPVGRKKLLNAVENAKRAHKQLI